jgi:hypothetical protein
MKKIEELLVGIGKLEENAKVEISEKNNNNHGKSLVALKQESQTISDVFSKKGKSVDFTKADWDFTDFSNFSSFFVNVFRIECR